MSKVRRFPGGGKLVFNVKGDELLSAGKHIATVSAGGNSNYHPSGDVSIEVTVNKAKQVVTWAREDIEIDYGDRLGSILQHAAIEGDKSKELHLDRGGGEVLDPTPENQPYEVAAWVEGDDNYLPSNKGCSQNTLPIVTRRWGSGATRRRATERPRSPRWRERPRSAGGTGSLASRASA